MGKPAARIGDMHTCPMSSGSTPHVGGPVMGPAVPNVIIGGKPAAVLGDSCTCVGPPDTIIMGSTGVFIGGKPSARQGDMTGHGGIISVGCPTVLIGETVGGSGDSEVGTEKNITNELKKAILDIDSSDNVNATKLVTLKTAAIEGTPLLDLCKKCEI